MEANTWFYTYITFFIRNYIYMSFCLCEWIFVVTMLLENWGKNKQVNTKETPFILRWVPVSQSMDHNFCKIPDHRKNGMYFSRANQSQLSFT